VYAGQRHVRIGVFAAPLPQQRDPQSHVVRDVRPQPIEKWDAHLISAHESPARRPSAPPKARRRPAIFGTQRSPLPLGGVYPRARAPRDPGAESLPPKGEERQSVNLSPAPCATTVAGAARGGGLVGEGCPFRESGTWPRRVSMRSIIAFCD